MSEYYFNVKTPYVYLNHWEENSPEYQKVLNSINDSLSLVDFREPHLHMGDKVEQLFTISNTDIIVESIKKAENSDAIIICMYETKGGNAKTAIRFNKTVKYACLVDLMEENEKETDMKNIQFHGFEIVTVKVEM